MVNLDFIEILLALKKYKSFKLTSYKLKISYTVLYRKINQLEKMGICVFENRRKVILSDWSIRACSLYEEFKKQIDDIK